MNIRRANSDDCAALTAIDAAGNPSPWSERQFLEAVENPADTVCVCERGGEICGFAVWREICGESELHLIAAAPGVAADKASPQNFWHIGFRRPQAKAYLACCWKFAQAMPPPSASTANTVLSKQACGKNYYPLPEGGYEDAILMEKPC